MGLFDWLKGKSDPALVAARELSQRRQQEIKRVLQKNDVPAFVAKRLDETRQQRQPWIATLTPAELLIARSHGIVPIGTVSATCWMHYGWSWTQGHAQGWEAALQRLRAEARACGANAVLDVKMRTVALRVENSMDFTLVGTAVRIEGMPASAEPVIATVPALEFVRLVDCDIVPTGLAIGAHFEFLPDWSNRTDLAWAGNIESRLLSQFREKVRRAAFTQLQYKTLRRSNGVLAHVNFGEMFEIEGEPKRYLARHIVVATTIDEKRSRTERKFSRARTDHAKRVLQHRGDPIPFEVAMMVDMCAGTTPLQARGAKHHQSYASNEEEGLI